MNSFDESFRRTEDIYTTHDITWQKGGARLREDDTLEQKFTLKYNVKKYETRKLSTNFYTLNIFDLVRKSSTFWLIRKSSAWRHVQFKLPLYYLALDVGDAISLDLAQFSSAPVKCIVEDMQFDPDNFTLTVNCWTPIRVGETEPFYWAWPSQQSATARWPLPGDNNGGGGYDFDVIPPAGSFLAEGFGSSSPITELSNGDPRPSDLDDTLPQVYCEYSDTFDPFDIEPDVNPRALEAKAKDDIVDNQLSPMETSLGGGAKSGGGSNSDDKNNNDVCGKPIDGGCGYSVNVIWHTSTLEGQAQARGVARCGGPCEPSYGCPSCTGPVWTVCHTFGAAFAATMYASSLPRKSVSSDFWTFLETSVVNVQVATIVGHDNVGNACTNLDDVELPSGPSGGQYQGEAAGPKTTNYN